MLKDVGAEKTTKASLPKKVDLRPSCPPIEDQEQIGSCTANAAAGLIEYFEQRAFGRHTDASRLFLYKVTRNLMNVTGDTGAFLRTTMGAMVLFGAPPEEYWPYETAQYDEEPPAFLYAFAQNFQTINYYRYDPPGIEREQVLSRIKTNLAAGLPAMFGFTVFRSISQAQTSGQIPYPSKKDREEGGHAVVAVGYDDALKIKNSNPDGAETKGAILIRNSWGAGWGEEGYGWLPYEYVRRSLAIDWWSVLKNEWIESKEFGPN
jgi:C1A family cysteine protease